MRDKRIIAVHRGGSLVMEHHRLLIDWAIKCCRRVLPLLKEAPDERLIHALEIADKWMRGEVPTGDAMKASLGAHAAARAYTDAVSIAVARSVGQAVATAHMADHSPGGALYALKALQSAGRSLDEEKAWQIAQLDKLPDDLADLIISMLHEKGRSLKVY